MSAPPANYAVDLTATDSIGTQGSETFTWPVRDPTYVTNPDGQSSVLNARVSQQIGGYDYWLLPVNFTATGLTRGRTIPAARPPRSGPPARMGTVRGKHPAATPAGLVGCRPNRSAKHFLTSPTLRAGEVRKQLHRTAPTQARTKNKIKGKGQKIKASGYSPRR